MYTRIMEIRPWTLRSAKLEKEHKQLQESLTSLGNGYMGMRGSFEETYSADSHLGTYIAGVWFPDKTRVGWWKNGYPKYGGKAINALNFSKVKILVDGQEVDLAKNDAARLLRRTRYAARRVAPLVQRIRRAVRCVKIPVHRAKRAGAYPLGSRIY